MQQMVDRGMELLASATTDIVEFGRLLGESWALKRRLATNVSNPFIDSLYQKAIDAGAVGGKLLGAGAGGFMLLCVRPDDRARVREALGDLISVPVKFEAAGSRVVLYQPNGL